MRLFLNAFIQKNKKYINSYIFIVVINLVNLFINISVSIFITPFIINRFGLNILNNYYFLINLLSYLSIFDFGMSSTIFRFVVKNRNDDVYIHKLTHFLKTFYSLILLFLLLIFLVLLCFNFIDNSLLINQNLFFLLFVSFILNFINNPLENFLNGMNFVFFTRIIAFSKSVVRILFLFVTYILYLSIELFILFEIIIAFTVFFVYIITTIKKISYKALKNRKHKFEFNFIYSFFQFSLWTFLVSLFNQFFWKSGISLIGFYSIDNSVSEFSLITNFAFYFQMFSITLTEFILPRLDLDSDNLKAFLKKYSVSTFYVLSMVYFGFFFFGERFIEIWIGDTFDSLYSNTLILLTSLYFSLSLGVFDKILFLNAKHKHKFFLLLLSLIFYLSMLFSFRYRLSVQSAVYFQSFIIVFFHFFGLIFLCIKFKYPILYFIYHLYLKNIFNFIVIFSLGFVLTRTINSFIFSSILFVVSFSTFYFFFGIPKLYKI